jgi:hypothetical protein
LARPDASPNILVLEDPHNRCAARLGRDDRQIAAAPVLGIERRGRLVKEQDRREIKPGAMFTPCCAPRETVTGARHQGRFATFNRSSMAAARARAGGDDGNIAQRIGDHLKA